ncbi:MAG: hypothetical protein IJT27_05765 [Clostridia bacterium]|nr:hypothetical protein [Clostridia bacterium]
MDRHSKAYEQYCWVMEKNIVFEETVFHNGTHEVRCTHFSECRDCGGCRNKSLKKVLHG